MRELKLKIEMQYPVVKELYTENYLIFLEGAEIRIPTSSHVLSFVQIVLSPEKNPQTYKNDIFEPNDFTEGLFSEKANKIDKK